MVARNFKDLRFPKEIGSPDAPTWVSFCPQEVTFGGAQRSNRRATGTPRFSALEDSIPNRINGIFNTARNFAQNIDVSSFLNTILGGVNVGGRISTPIGDINFGLTTRQDTVNTSAAINLYMPINVQANLEVNYTQENLGVLGQNLAQQLTGGSSAEGLDRIKELAGGTLGGAVQDFIRGSSKATAIQAVATGRIINPYSYQIFQGVNHRRFEYNFKLTPRDPNEADVIRQIVELFYYYSLPQETNAADGDFHFFTVPHQWHIEYYREGNEIKYMQSPRSCFLTSISAQYTSEAHHTHSDGAPIQTELGLVFVEIEPITRNDLEDPNSPSNTGPTRFSGGAL